MIKSFEQFINEGYYEDFEDEYKEHENRDDAPDVDDKPADFSELLKYFDEVEWVDIGHPKYLFAKYDLGEIKVKELLKTQNPQFLPENIKYINLRLLKWVAEKCEFDENETHVICKGKKGDIFFDKSDNGIGSYFLGWIKMRPLAHVSTETHLRYIWVGENAPTHGRGIGFSGKRVNKYIAAWRDYWSGYGDRFSLKFIKRKK